MQSLDKTALWATVPKKSLWQLATLLKRCAFLVSGKGEFKDEFVTAGGVPLTEVDLKTMESKLCPHLFFAGEVLLVD
jgi:predicted flavoprotein YhiN